MDANFIIGLAKIGAVSAISIAAIGSAIGTGTAGMASIGAWKKCYAQSKSAPFLLLIFIGAPLSQTIYGMILMNAFVGKIEAENGAETWPVFIVAGILAGVAMAMSAAWQGKAGAAGADALAETGQGFGNYLMTIGVVETVALFVLVFIQGAV